jgi:hypothetical protein
MGYALCLRRYSRLSETVSDPMRRIRSHIQLVATLIAICLGGQVVGVAVAGAASSPTINKAALNQQVQEALAKAQAEKGAGAQGGAGAGSAGVGGNSEAFSNLTNGKVGEEEPTIPTTARTTTASSTSGISMNVIVPILALAAILLGGIAFFIMRDSRGMAPAGDGLASMSSAQERAARQRKRRAKAKAARRQRKRNR